MISLRISFCCDLFRLKTLNAKPRALIALPVLIDLISKSCSAIVQILQTGIFYLLFALVMPDLGNKLIDRFLT